MITGRSSLYYNTWSGNFGLWIPEITNNQGKSVLVRVNARFSKDCSYRESTVCIISFKATVLYWLNCDPLLTSTFSNAPWCWLHISLIMWLNWLQISFSILGLLLFVIFPCLCWLYILLFPGRSLPSFFVAFFRANLILAACFVLCVACEQGLQGFSIRSRHRAPRESLLAGYALCRESGRIFCRFVVFVACFTVVGRLHVSFLIMPYQVACVLGTGWMLLGLALVVWSHQFYPIYRAGSFFLARSANFYILGWTGRLDVFSVDTDFLFFRRDRYKSLAWCLLHILQHLVLTLVLRWYRWVHRRPKLNISRCINFSEHVLRYWVWEPVLSAPPDYELRSPIIERNKALQSIFLRTEIILAICRKRSLEGRFFKTPVYRFPVDGRNTEVF